MHEVKWEEGLCGREGRVGGGSSGREGCVGGRVVWEEGRVGGGSCIVVVQWPGVGESDGILVGGCPACIA